MGLSNGKDNTWEVASEKHTATLYYFGGRGLADQIRFALLFSVLIFIFVTVEAL